MKFNYVEIFFIVFTSMLIGFCIKGCEVQKQIEIKAKEQSRAYFLEELKYGVDSGIITINHDRLNELQEINSPTSTISTISLR